MTEEDLAKLLSSNESEQGLEVKASANKEEEIRQAICAFANDLAGTCRSGTIVVGVTPDLPRTPVAGFTVDEQLLEKFANYRSNGQLLPFPQISVTENRFDGGPVVVIEVQPSLSPPVRFNGVTWVRVGPSRRRATPEEERRLSERRRSSDLPFDHSAVSGAGLSDLNLDLFRESYLPSAVSDEVLAENGRPVDDQLRSLRFLTSDGLPSVAALLAFGIDPQSWLSGAYVQFVRFEGEDAATPIIDEQRFDGPLPSLIAEMDATLRSNVRTRVLIPAEGVEERRPDYAMEALTQLTRNAVMHRQYEVTNAPTRVYWYADRIEINSPGGPFGVVTPETFGTVSDYRNPLLAEAMKTFGFVQKFGVGIPIARRQTEQIGGRLEWDVSGGGVTWRLFPAGVAGESP